MLDIDMMQLDSAYKNAIRHLEYYRSLLEFVHHFAAENHKLGSPLVLFL